MVIMACDNERRTQRGNVFHTTGARPETTRAKNRRDRTHGFCRDKFAAPEHLLSPRILKIRSTDRLKATAALPDVRSSTPAVTPPQCEVKDPHCDGNIAYWREPIGPRSRGVGARRADQNADAECQQ